MNEKKLSLLTTQFYYCYSKTISIIIDIPELEIIQNKELLLLQINYKTMALSSKLFSITNEYLESYCDLYSISGEDIMNKLTTIDDGLYCLLTETNNLKYCNTFIAHPDMLHYVVIEKKNSRFYIIDFINETKFYKEIMLSNMNFKSSVLTVIKKNGIKKNEISTETIINYYYEKKTDNNKYDIYKKKIYNTVFTLDSAIDFATSGMLSTRLAIIDLYLKENKSNEFSGFLISLNNLNEKIKLLLVKLHFSNSIKDKMKLKNSICLFEELEEKILDQLRR